MLEHAAASHWFAVVIVLHSFEFVRVGRLAAGKAATSQTVAGQTLRTPLRLSGRQLRQVRDLPFCRSRSSCACRTRCKRRRSPHHALAPHGGTSSNSRRAFTEAAGGSDPTVSADAPRWEPVPFVLSYRIGEFTLFRRQFRGLALLEHFFDLSDDPGRTAAAVRPAWPRHRSDRHAIASDARRDAGCAARRMAYCVTSSLAIPAFIPISRVTSTRTWRNSARNRAARCGARSGALSSSAPVAKCASTTPRRHGGVSSPGEGSVDADLSGKATRRRLAHRSPNFSTS